MQCYWLTFRGFLNRPICTSRGRSKMFDRTNKLTRRFIARSLHRASWMKIQICGKGRSFILRERTSLSRKHYLPIYRSLIKSIRHKIVPQTLPTHRYDRPNKDYPYDRIAPYSHKQINEKSWMHRETIVDDTVTEHRFQVRISRKGPWHPTRSSTALVIREIIVSATTRYADARNEWSPGGIHGPDRSF